MNLNELTDVLATLFNDDTKIGALLDRSGIPRGRVRALGSAAPVNFWREVCEELAAGLVENGINQLVAKARETYPGNPKLREWTNPRRNASPKVFLSYARADVAEVDLLYDALVVVLGSADDVYQDTRSTPLGSDWHDVIMQSLTSANMVVCWVTPAFLGSSYVPYEVGVAVAQGATVVPVVADSAALGNAPAWLTRRQGIPLHPPVDYAALARKIVATIPAAAGARP